jgi:uncharacterized protein
MHSLLDPAILFFVFGLFAGLVRSNLEIPTAVSRFLSLYLLMALGLKGGFALHASGLNSDIALSLLSAIVLAALIPAVGYWVLKRKLNSFDAAAVAATYGSVSAVTFITAVQYLDNKGLAYGGHMAAAMALMESPAIVMAIMLANLARRKTCPQKMSAPQMRLGHVLHEAMTDGAQMLLLGAMLIGILTGPTGLAVMKPFTSDLFKGLLAFFLLDMGLHAARNMGHLRGQSSWVLVYALLGPLTHALVALGLSWMLGLSAGNGGLLMVLAASASYIAVPAVIKHAIPEANSALYLGMSLGVTFPFNIVIGIPLYLSLAFKLLPA